jgi:hypothetical protein
MVDEIVKRKQALDVGNMAEEDNNHRQTKCDDSKNQ